MVDGHVTTTPGWGDSVSRSGETYVSANSGRAGAEVPTSAAHHARHSRRRGGRTAVVIAPSHRQVAGVPPARPSAAAPAPARSEGIASDESHHRGTMTTARNVKWSPPKREDLPGADDGTRTRDPHLGKVMLYQLSHVRVQF